MNSDDISLLLTTLRTHIARGETESATAALDELSESLAAMYDTEGDPAVTFEWLLSLSTERQDPDNPGVIRFVSGNFGHIFVVVFMDDLEENPLLITALVDKADPGQDIMLKEIVRPTRSQVLAAFDWLELRHNSPEDADGT